MSVFFLSGMRIEHAHGDFKMGPEYVHVFVRELKIWTNDEFFDKIFDYYRCDSFV